MGGTQIVPAGVVECETITSVPWVKVTQSTPLGALAIVGARVPGPPVAPFVNTMCGKPLAIVYVFEVLL